MNHKPGPKSAPEIFNLTTCYCSCLNTWIKGYFKDLLSAIECCSCYADDMASIGGVLEKLSLRTTLRLDLLVSPGSEAFKMAY